MGKLFDLMDKSAEAAKARNTKPKTVLTETPDSRVEPKQGAAEALEANKNLFANQSAATDLNHKDLNEYFGRQVYSNPTQPPVLPKAMEDSMETAPTVLDNRPDIKRAAYEYDNKVQSSDYEQVYEDAVKYMQENFSEDNPKQDINKTIELLPTDSKGDIDFTKMHDIDKWGVVLDVISASLVVVSGGSIPFVPFSTLMKSGKEYQALATKYVGLAKSEAANLAEEKRAEGKIESNVKATQMESNVNAANQGVQTIGEQTRKNLQTQIEAEMKKDSLMMDLMNKSKSEQLSYFYNKGKDLGLSSAQINKLMRSIEGKDLTIPEQFKLFANGAGDILTGFGNAVYSFLGGAE